MNREITVYSTRGQQKQIFNTDVNRWGELKSLITQDGSSLDGLVATENVNRTNLEHTDATLPSGDFIVFLRPAKTKSGANDHTYIELIKILDIDRKKHTCDIRMYVNDPKTELIDTVIEKAFQELDTVIRSLNEYRNDLINQIYVIRGDEDEPATEKNDLDKEFEELEKGFDQ